MLISAIQQSDSVTYIHTHGLLHILIHYSLSQDIDISLSYTRGPHCSSIMCTADAVCICQPRLPNHFPLPLATTSLFSILKVCFYCTDKFICVLDFMCKQYQHEFLPPISNQIQFSSVAQSCPTLCNPMNHSTPVLPVHHQLPGFTHTHVHRVSDAIQPSHSLSSTSPSAPNPSQHHSLFQ